MVDGNATRDKVLKLMADKQNLEIQINAYGQTLEANANVGMHGPLIDSEGYPRNDIDVYQVRQARQQIICLQNNHKILMKTIEQQLHKLHAEAREQQQELTQETSRMNLNSPTEAGVDTEPPTPIVKIIKVESGSPAEKAGLCSGDEIAEFGSVNGNNFNKELSTIASVVNHMRNQRIPLKVIRRNEVLDMILIPQTWSGKGLLGCNIVLVN